MISAIAKQTTRRKRRSSLDSIDDVDMDDEEEGSEFEYDLSIQESSNQSLSMSTADASEIEYELETSWAQPQDDVPPAPYFPSPLRPVQRPTRRGQAALKQSKKRNLAVPTTAASSAPPPPMKIPLMRSVSDQTGVRPPPAHRIKLDPR